MTLDQQVEHLDAQSLAHFGRWLLRAWNRCQERKLEAEDMLRELGIPDSVLREQWAAQVKAQTKPAPRRSQNKSKKAIEEILALRNTVESYDTEIADLETKLLANSHSSAPIDYIDLNTQLTEIRRKKKLFQERIQRGTEALGVTDRHDLRSLINNKFLQLRMNARALKLRLRQRLCDRKFELELLERAYRNTVNDKKLSSHTEAAMKRREPSILNVVKTYNELCSQMRSLLQRGQAPTGATVPLEMIREGIFALDVDDNIWQDIGLDDESDGQSVPLWLGDEAVRLGIRLRLELDRCIEEEARLRHERCALQEWFMSEWIATQSAQAEADVDLAYQLDRYLETLRILCVNWKSIVGVITPAFPMPASWGPSDQELHETAIAEVHGNWEDVTSVDDEEDLDEELDWLDEEETALVEDVERLALSEAYHSTSSYDFDTTITSVEISPPRQTVSPHKRSRMLIDE